MVDFARAVVLMFARYAPPLVATHAPADATFADLQEIPSLSGFLIDGRGLESLPDAAVRDLLQAFRDGAFALKAG